MAIKSNIDIREMIKHSHFKQWEIARRMQISEYKFSRMLRKELSPQEKLSIYRTIDILQQEQNQNH